MIGHRGPDAKDAIKIPIDHGVSHVRHVNGCPNK